MGAVAPRRSRAVTDLEGNEKLGAQLRCDVRVGAGSSQLGQAAYTSPSPRLPTPPGQHWGNEGIRISQSLSAGTSTEVRARAGVTACDSKSFLRLPATERLPLWHSEWRGTPSQGGSAGSNPVGATRIGSAHQGGADLRSADAW